MGRMSFWEAITGNKKLQDSPIQNEVTRHITLNLDPLGSSGTESYSGYPQEDYLDKLQGYKKSEIYDEMRRSDAEIKMVLSAVKNPIMGASWEIEPGSSEDIDKRIAEFCEHILFNDMEKPFEDFIQEALSFVDFGHSIFEITDKVVLNHKKWGSYNGLKILGYRSPKTIQRWNLDGKTGKLLSVSQEAYGDLERYVDIPGEFLVVFSLNKEGDNYEGISGLRPCYGPWLRKNKFSKLKAIGLEKYAVPTPVLSVPLGKEESPQFSKAVDVMKKYVSHQQQFITKPEGWEIDFLQTQFDAEKIGSIVKDENMEIVHAFLANFLLLGQQGSGGAYALSVDLSDFFLSGIEYLAKIISGQMNRVVLKRLVDLNFGRQEYYPKLKARGISDKVGKELGELLKILVDARILSPDQNLEVSLRQRIGLPKIDESSIRRAPTTQIQSNINMSERIEMGGPGSGGAREGAGRPPGSGTEFNGKNSTELAKEANIKSKEALKKGDRSKYEKLKKLETLAQDHSLQQELLSKITKDHPDYNKISDKIKDQENEIKKRLKYLSENHESEVLKFSEVKKMIKDSKAQLKDLMETELVKISEGLVSQIMGRYKKSTPATQLNAIKDLAPKGQAEYKQILLDLMAQISEDALQDVKKEVPKAKNIKLAEFEKLPKDIQKSLKILSDLLVGTQIDDLIKNLSFRYQSSVKSTDSALLIESDLNEAATAFIFGPSIEAGSGNVAGQVVNEARNAFFFDDEVLEEVESFTFVNGDPVSPICQDLAGRVFAKDDPNFDRYMPPLHHNCKSYIVPNLKGTTKKVDEIGLKPSKPELEKYITLCEKYKIRCQEGELVAQSIVVTKKIAATSDIARTLALEYSKEITGPIETEQTYIFDVRSMSLFIDGTLKTFEPLEGVILVMGILKPIEMAEDTGTLQTVIISKDKAKTIDEAKRIAKEVGAERIDKIDETNDSYRFRQRDPSDFIDGSFRSKTIDQKGATLVYGKLK